MDDLAALLLTALVEGYRARADMKERGRALTEYEIARRAGLTDASYAEYSETARRDEVRAVLEALEGEGWVSVWQRVGRYDAYVPTEAGLQRASPLAPPAAEVDALTVAGALADAQRLLAAPASPAPEAAASLAHIAAQLDEVVRLLRAIDAKLERAI